MTPSRLICAGLCIAITAPPAKCDCLSSLPPSLPFPCAGWWMCGVDGKVGWAPPSYLKKCEGDMGMESDDSDEDNPTGEPVDP